MDVFDVIETRRSIRKFTDEPVDRPSLERILNAGFSAPTAHNLKPWHFVVVSDRETLNSFADYATYQKMLYEADKAIVVCGDSKKQSTHDLLVNDCSAAVENMLLAAHGLGLGACWCGIVQVSLIEFFSKALLVPEHIVPMALIALGHPGETRGVPERYNEKRVYAEQFGKEF